MIGIMLSAVVAVEGDGLITDDPAGAIGRRRVQATGIEIGFGTGHKKGAGLVQRVEPLDLSLADGRFAPDVLEITARRAAKA